MPTLKVEKTIADAVKEHTILAAFTSVNGNVSPLILFNLQSDLSALNKLDSTPIVEASKTLVTATILYVTNKNNRTKADADKAREQLADMLIHTKETR